MTDTDPAKDANTPASGSGGEDAAIPFASLPANQAGRKEQHSPGLEKDNHSRTASGRFRFSFRKKSQKVKRGEAEDLTQKCSFITREQAECVESELLTEYSLTLDQLLEHGGLSAAVAFARLYPRETLGGRDGTILVCCGPGNNGGYGLVIARYLKIFGYKLTVFYPKTPAKPAYRALLGQCEKMDIPFLSYMPGDVQVLDHNYCLIVDALFGYTFKAPVRPDLGDVLQKLADTSVPIVSIDVPSGWEADKAAAGPGGSHQLRPDTLISLLLPKRCSLEFTGRRHYIAGRLLPPTLAAKLDLRTPAWALHDVAYPLVDCQEGIAASGSAGQLADKSEASAGTGGVGAAASNVANNVVAASGTGGVESNKKSDKSAVNCF